MRAFFRKKPAQMNIMTLIIETWNIGVSIGFVLYRAGVLLFVGSIYLGRIDMQLFADGIDEVQGVGKLDDLPLNFRKDLLLHEVRSLPYGDMVVVKRVLNTGTVVTLTILDF